MFRSKANFFLNCPASRGTRSKNRISLAQEPSQDHPQRRAALTTCICIPGDSDGRVCLRCRRPVFDPWVGKIPWRRELQSTPVFLPGEFHGLRSLAGHSSWGCKESDMTHTHTLFIPVLYIYHVVSPIPMTLNGTYTFRHKFRNRMQSPDQNSLLHAKPSS